MHAVSGCSTSIDSSANLLDEQQHGLRGQELAGEQDGPDPESACSTTEMRNPPKATPSAMP